MRNETILVVDDNPAIRALVRFFLEGAGYSALMARDAENAIALYKMSPRFNISLLLTDVEMPDGNGLDLAEDIRRLQPTLPVLLMSGSENPDRGFDYLGKPFTRADLIHSVNHALTSPKSATMQASA